jgi:hypothetical protein
MTCTNCTPIFGIWNCPISAMAGWKALGINTLVNNEKEGGRYTQAQWRAAAAAAGLNYIDSPSANIAADNADPHLIAFLQEDEPDYRKLPVSTWSDRYAAIRAVSQKPIYGNFSGTNVTFARTAVPPYNGNQQTPFIPYATWLGFDWYPNNRNPGRYGNTELLIAAHDLLEQWSGGKPILPFIECSFQNVSGTGRAPTEAEMKAQVRAMMAKNTLGVVFFPERLPGDVGFGSMGFLFDNTTPTMKVAIQEIIAEFSPTPAAKTQKHILWSDGTWTSV